MITSAGVMIRIKVSDVNVIGRATSGVKVIKIDKDKGITLASIAKVKEVIGNEYNYDENSDEQQTEANESEDKTEE